MPRRSRSPRRKRTYSSDYRDSPSSRYSKRRRSRSPDHRSRRKDQSSSRDQSSRRSQDNSLIKAKVQEVNNEISCSIEETNRIRLSLGLKPLNVDPPKPKESNEISCSIEETNKMRATLGLKPLNMQAPKKVKDLTKTKEQIDQEREREELVKRLEQSKKKRELHAKLPGKSLGEELDAPDSALDWVNASRRKAMESRQQQRDAVRARAQELREQEDYASKDLKGMKVSHDIDAFDEGTSTILTLKDSRILGPDGDQVNEESDELQNVSLAERDKHLMKEKAKKRMNQPAYNVYDDNEFDPTNASRARNILSQYDEEDDAAHAGIVLGVDGNVTEAQKQERAAAVREKLNASLVKKKKATTEAIEKKVMGDYYTEEEMVSFSKPKKMRKKKKKRRKVVEPDAVVESQPEEQLDEETQGSASLRVSDPVEEDFDYELSISNTRLERLKEAQKRKKSRQPGADYAGQLAQSILHEAQEMDVDAVPGDTKEVVFSEATDFDARLRSALDERKEQAEAKISKEKLPLDEREESKMEIEEPPVFAAAEKTEEDGEEESEEHWGQEQPLVGSSMSAALSLLRSSGSLRATEKPRLAGRANDARNVDENITVGKTQKASEFVLEYRDEHGRLLTKQEAFRQLSYKFHGQKPGKKKQDKKIRAMKEEIKMQKLLSGEGSSATMKALERRQKNAKQAHVVLYGGNNGSNP